MDTEKPTPPATPAAPPAPKAPAREITGTIRPRDKVPDHVVKHPNPVGRPKNRNTA